MYKTALLFTTLVITGCAGSIDSTRGMIDDMRYGEKSTTPIPTDEFIAVGNYRHKAGALEIATDNANAFCKRWRASPAIISQETKKMHDDNIGKSITRSTKEALTGEGSANDLYETTIKYKCY